MNDFESRAENLKSNYLVFNGQIRASSVAQMVKNLPTMQLDPGSIPGSGRSPGEGNGSPLQSSCLKNSMDRGVWWAAALGVRKSGPD